MKVVSKKKFAEEKDAKKFLESKYGQPVELVKPHRTRWLFKAIVGAVTNAITSFGREAWHVYLADYKSKNPDTPHLEAVKLASVLWKELKANA